MCGFHIEPLGYWCGREGDKADASLRSFRLIYLHTSLFASSLPVLFYSTEKPAGNDEIHVLDVQT